MFIFLHLLPTRMQITIHWLHICKCQKWRRMSDFSDRSRRDQFISAENLISTINKHPVPSSTAFSSEKNCKTTLFLISVKLARLIDSDVKLIRVCWGYWSIINQTELLWSIINQTSYCFAFRHIAQAQWGADYGRWFPWLTDILAKYWPICNFRPQMNQVRIYVREILYSYVTFIKKWSPKYNAS